MTFQKNRTAAELISEIKHVDDAMTFFCYADSITVSTVNYERGQECKIERSLNRADIINTVYSALFDQFYKLLDDLRAVDPDGKNLLELRKAAASKIDPRQPK